MRNMANSGHYDRITIRFQTVTAYLDGFVVGSLAKLHENIAHILDVLKSLGYGDIFGGGVGGSTDGLSMAFPWARNAPQEKNKAAGRSDVRGFIVGVAMKQE